MSKIIDDYTAALAELDQAERGVADANRAARDARAARKSAREHVEKLRGYARDLGADLDAIAAEHSGGSPAGDDAGDDSNTTPSDADTSGW